MHRNKNTGQNKAQKYWEIFKILEPKNTRTRTRTGESTRGVREEERKRKKERRRQRIIVCIVVFCPFSLPLFFAPLAFVN